MTTAKNDVLLGYTLVGGGWGVGGELTFVGGIKIWWGGGSLLGGFFQISGRLALFWLVGGGLSPPYCSEKIASGIWQIGWTCSGMAENDKVLQNDQ